MRARKERDARRNAGGMNLPFKIDRLIRAP
jgi:hypothetical protein